MSNPYPRLPLENLRVFPLSERRSMASVEETMVDPSAPPPTAPPAALEGISSCAAAIRQARARNASVILMYGAHLVKNGGGPVVARLAEGGWLSHLATQGAGTIHDWEFAYLGRSTESVRDNVATGTFGTWDETSRFLHLALLAGNVRDEGYGQALGRFIAEDGVNLPVPSGLESAIRAEPGHPLAAARADLLKAMTSLRLPGGFLSVKHPWKRFSILARAFLGGVPVSVHPGIGYDIISNHPLFDGAAIGRAAGTDFRVFGHAVNGLDGGVLLSVGSAIMAPQVFEKSLSCVNNLRLREKRPIVLDHRIFVVDLQDAGRWDWNRGEPPRDDPSYYLRFCKSFHRMGGSMAYTCCDNVVFLQHLLRVLEGR